MTPALAGDRGVNTVMSGPAGGVLGAVAVARAAGFERIVTFDMGGTSTDVSLYDGRLSFTSESEVGGLPIRVSMLDIHSVGAGGGSIAYFDRAGALKVGPRSASAAPGPVCYGVGEEIAVTDANLLLGRIDPKRFLSGRMQLDVDRARDRMGRMADQAGVSVEKLAESIIEVANSNMERAIRKISVERGRDPREFTLLSFGGAGGLHACELAARLEMKTVLIPKDAGVLSALGMLTAEFVRDFSASVLDRNVEAAFADLEARAAPELADEGFAEVRLERSLDLRYAGQSFEITLPYAERERFDDAHERLYGYSHAGRAVEAVTARVRAIGVSDDDSALDLAAPSDDQDFSSVYVPAGWKERTDSAGNQIVTLKT
jgi:N-methylhydantoinase A/oxoprolinase/acetone carboxylase beta subunit